MENMWKLSLHIPCEHLASVWWLQCTGTQIDDSSKGIHRNRGLSKRFLVIGETDEACFKAYNVIVITHANNQNHP